MKELLVKETEQLKGLEPSKAEQIKKVFEPMAAMLASFEKAYADVIALEITPKTCALAKRLRLAIGHVRTDADKARKAEKAKYLRAGNAIQGVYNILKDAVADKEEKLQEIENHYDRIVAEKIFALQAEREEELLKYDFDGSTLDLGQMVQPVWTNFLNGTRLNYEAVKDAERKAEEEQLERERKEKISQDRKDLLIPYSQFSNYSSLILDTSENEFIALQADAIKKKRAYEDEQEEIRLENERLRIEKEKAEKKRIADQKKLDAERKRTAEKLRKAGEERKALERKIAADKAEKIRLEKEEAKRIADEEEKAAAAPDKEKILAVIKTLTELVTNLTTDTAMKAVESARDILSDAAEGM